MQNYLPQVQGPSQPARAPLQPIKPKPATNANRVVSTGGDVPEKRKYMTPNNASEAARQLRSKDQEARKQGAAFMANYRKKKGKKE